MDINEFVKGIDDQRLKNAVGKLASTAEGSRLLKSITEEDRRRLLKSLGGLSASGITREMLLQKMNSPDVIKQISAFLNKR